MTDTIPDKARRAFAAQRDRAKQRDIPFLFTLEEWWAWWQVDGRWERRGRRWDKLVMARHGDTGPYAPWNVYPATHRENSLEGAQRRAAGHANMTPEARFRMGSRLRVRGDGHPMAKAVITPLGRFGSAALAAEAHGIGRCAAGQKARTRWKGWRYEADEDGAP